MVNITIMVEHAIKVNSCRSIKLKYCGFSVSDKVYKLEENTPLLDLKCIIANELKMNIMEIRFTKFYIENYEHRILADNSPIKNFTEIDIWEPNSLSFNMYYQTKIFLNGEQLDHLKNIYNYNFPLVLKLNIEFMNMCGDDVKNQQKQDDELWTALAMPGCVSFMAYGDKYFANEGKKKIDRKHGYLSREKICIENYKFETGATFMDLTNIVQDEIVKSGIMNKSQIEIIDINDFRCGKVGYYDKSYKHTRYTRRDISVTFCPENQTGPNHTCIFGKKTCDFNVYANVPMLNRFNTGDDIHVRVGVIKNNYIKIFLGDGKEYIHIDKNDRIEDIIKIGIINIDSHNNIIDIRKILVLYKGKILEHTDLINCHLSNNDVVSFKILEHAVPKKNTDDELFNRVISLIENNYKQSPENIQYLFKNLDIIYDTKILLKQGDNVREYKLSMGVILSHSDIDGTNVFILWKQNQKHTESKTNSMIIDLLSLPFNTFSWEQNNLAIIFLIEFIYSNIDYKNIRQYIKNLPCILKWCDYFSMNKLKTFLNNEYICEYYNRVCL
ncbi:MAG: hypothetical protein Edafosvirus3_70 [Edafosvirus sp.]|uniref:Uncharacterized protein n=1 Tax=Edafosvirus sp. TaxID=2487765 RepID=A0A3G4ZSV1_9VIRU|nr:MAG: hypothetical protein Edafosvirus3_70 [Edafosvirus sp.]